MQFLSLAEAARRLPTTSGKPISIPTLWRWCTHGCRGVKLAHGRLGRRITVTEEALIQFSEALAAAWDQPVKPATPTPAPRTPKPRTAAQREKAILAAEARLKKRGCMSE